MHHLQIPLFESPYVLDWLPDETLFSLASRHHRLSGHSVAELTCRQLFGDSQRGSQHDLPCNVDVFVARTRNLLGNGDAVIRDHTILPYFLPFQSMEGEIDAIGALRGSSLGSLKYRLGLLTSRFRANHPLKTCPDCRQGDLDRYGVAYWHRIHQLPGVWYCLEHQVRLQEASIKSTGVGRFLWHLPAKATLVAEAPDSAVSNLEELNAQLRQIAKIVADYVGTTAHFRFDIPKLLRTYHGQLLKQGLLKPGGGLRLGHIGAAFSDYTAPLRSIREFAALPSNAGEGAAQAGRLLRAPRSGTHPLRHLVLISWLFGSWNAFLTAYRSEGDVGAKSQASVSTIAAQRRAQPSVKSEKVVALIRDEGLSATEASRRIGVDVATAIGWAATAGIETTRRQSVVTGQLRERMLTKLAAGDEKLLVATECNVSIPTVNRLLRSEPGLQRAWIEAQLALTRARYRLRWEAIAVENRTLGATALRRIDPKIYAWLYRNDRSWLSEKTELRTMPSRGNHSNVDWDARDEALALSVRRTVEAIAAEQPGTRIDTWKIYQRLPELKAKLSRLPHLPLTRRVLEESTRPMRLKSRRGRLL